MTHVRLRLRKRLSMRAVHRRRNYILPREIAIHRRHLRAALIGQELIRSE